MITIDIAISKTDMIIFNIEIAYVSNLAHPCICPSKKNTRVKNE
jgi:hypothetical protein